MRKSNLPSLPSLHQTGVQGSSTSSDGSPETDAPTTFPFHAPTATNTAGTVPPAPTFLNADDFLVLKASSECE